MWHLHVMVTYNQTINKPPVHSTRHSTPPTQSRIPFYYILKLAAVVYLQAPKTRGAVHLKDVVLKASWIWDHWICVVVVSGMGLWDDAWMGVYDAQGKAEIELLYLCCCVCLVWVWGMMRGWVGRSAHGHI
jgi:hypothetical protein